jgi:hypothetical protein
MPNVPFTTVASLSSTMYVSLRISATAIRASSCVNLSKRCRASSISFFPTSFFKYFSENILETTIYHREQRTRSTLPHLLRCDREDIKHLDHYLYNYVRHCICWLHCRISLEALEEVLHVSEEIGKSVLACFNIFGCLLRVGCRNDIRTAILEDSYREQNPNTSEDHVCWGEHLQDWYQVSESGQVDFRGPTSPTPPPRATEKAKRTLIAGSSHRDNLSLLEWSNS